MRWESDKDVGWLLGFDHEGQDVFMKKRETALRNCIVPNVEEERSTVLITKMNMQIRNEDTTISEKMHNVLSIETRERLPPLREIEKQRLMKVSKSVDEVMNKIEVGNITKLNDLVYVGVVVVTKMLGIKNRKSTRIKP